MSSFKLSKRRFVQTMLGGLTLGCGGLHNFPFDTMADSSGATFELTFYGVGCFGIRFNGVQVLTDPFFTYLPFRKVAFGTVLPDPQQVDPYLDNFTDVKAMLVGHAHYDHNLDLPYIAKGLREDCYVLGSRTLKHTFAPNKLPTPFVICNEDVATESSVGRWWTHPSGKFRVLPILSAHPNQYLFFHLYKRKVTSDRQSIPSKVHHYQEGMTFAFLLDFLDTDGAPIHRTYIQTSSTGLPMGAFPNSILEERSLDVACIAMDCANLKMQGKHTVIDAYPAPHTFFCHYEDFFRSKDQPVKEIVKVDLPKTKAFFDQFSDRKFYYPKFDTTFRL